MDLLDVAQKLYELPPTEFTAARNAQAKDASSAGKRELATEIRTLPRPSAAAWALNELVRSSPESSAQFATLGRELRSAQRSAKRDDLNRLVQDRKKLIRAATATIRALASQGGVGLSQTAINEIEQSLLAALADEAAFAAVFSGRLIRTLQSDGLEPVDVAEAVAGPPLAHTGRAIGSSNSGKRVSATSAKTRAASAKAHAALLVKTRRAAQAADAALETARQSEHSLQADRDELDDDLTALKEQFDSLERRRSDLDARASQVARELRKAEDAAREAHDAADVVTEGN
jgi:hypothetical protein